MSDLDGTYSQLVELTQTKPNRLETAHLLPKNEPNTNAGENLLTTPYISQNYRFTESELRWLRRQSLTLTERLGWKVSQNVILRVSLHILREACAKNAKDNPLLDALARLKK